MLFQLLFQTPQFQEKSYSQRQTLELFSSLKFESSADGSNTYIAILGQGKVCSVKYDSRDNEPYTLNHSQPNYATGAIEKTSYKFSAECAPVGVSKSKIYPDEATADVIGKYVPLVPGNKRELNSLIEALERTSGVRSPLFFPPRNNS